MIARYEIATKTTVSNTSMTRMGINASSVTDDRAHGPLGPRGAAANENGRTRDPIPLINHMRQNNILAFLLS